MDVTQIVFPPDASLQEAIAAIRKSHAGIAVITDESGRLIGTVTDGDVRRALLAGQDTSVKIRAVMAIHPQSAPAGTSSAECYEIMRASGIFHLPLVDETGRVVDLATLAELANDDFHPNEVVLMAGGLGRRLHPITNNIPKPMVSVGGRPILQTIVESFIASRFGRFTISLNHLGEQIQDHFGDGSRLGIDIRYIYETKRMGTAGCLSMLTERPTEPFFVMNGDILTSIDFEQMLNFHNDTAAVITMAVNTYTYEVPYGVAKIEGPRLVSLTEKPRQSLFISAGIYVLSPETLDEMRDDEFYDMPTLINDLLAQGSVVSAFPVHEYWLDIGRPDDLARAESEYDTVFK